MSGAKFERYKAGDKPSASDLNRRGNFLAALANMAVEGGEFTCNEAGAALAIGSNEWIELVELQDDLASPSNGLEDKETAEALKIRPEFPPSVKVSDLKIEISNRFSDYSASEGDLILVFYHSRFREWWPTGIEDAFTMGRVTDPTTDLQGPMMVTFQPRRYTGSASDLAELDAGDAVTLENYGDPLPAVHFGVYTISTGIDYPFFRRSGIWHLGWPIGFYE